MLAELIDKRCHTFTFGECEFSLRYTLSALLELERKGLSFMDIFSESLTGRQIIDFFSAGLCASVTLDPVASRCLGKSLRK